MAKILTEGNTEFYASLGKIASKKLEVFYNPVMKYNRDTTIEVLKEYFKNNKDLKFLLPLSGSGIRGIRLINETNLDVSELCFNDMSEKAIKFIKKNIKLHKKPIRQKKIKVKVTQNKAQLLFQKSGMYNYIDVDPFGSSLPFIESAVASIYNNGILAITNTDTAALCGSYPKVTKRRYGSVPYNHEIRQEFGLRILIKRVQEIAAMQDVALIPIFSYSKDHYMRAMFKVVRSKEECEKILSKHKYFEADKNRILSVSKKSEGKNVVGPAWAGELCNNKILSKVDLKDKFTLTLKEENKIKKIFFYDPHEICKMIKADIPSYDKIFEKVKGSRTTFSKTGIKCDLNKDKFIQILKKK